MRLFLILSMFFPYFSDAQNCKSTTMVKAQVWGTTCKDSMDAACFRKISGLRAVDENFSITSYVVRLDGAGFDLQVEVLNTGADLNEAKIVVKYIRPGTFIEFSCIKARHSNGYEYILQPMVFSLK